MRGSSRTTMAGVLAISALASCSNEPAPPAWFRDVAAAKGLQFEHTIGAERRHWFPEIVGGGVGLLDYDGDGDLDVYCVQSGDLDPKATSRPGNQLFRNRGDFTFEDVTATAGVGDAGYGMGCACADYDGDGDVDLYVTNVGRNVLYRNNGDGTFTDATSEAGVGDTGWGTSAVFLDYNRDGMTDLFVVNYLVWTLANDIECHTSDGGRDYCMPTNYDAPQRDVLYRGNGDGTFTDVTLTAGLGAAFGNGLGVACGDLDLDGYIDIYVANDSNANQYWVNNGDGTFTDDALVAGCAFNLHGKAEAGMGVACIDIEDDGDLDLFMTHLISQTNTLYVNDGNGFEDKTASMGLGLPSTPYTGFGVGFADFDHDGVTDVYIANGRVVLGAKVLLPEDPYAEPNLVQRGVGGGRFEELSSLGGTAEPLYGASRGAAFGDLDEDGDVDVVVIESNGKARLLENIAPKLGSSVSFRVVDAKDQIAVGATVELTTDAGRQFGLVQIGYSYLASNDPRVHFGLGAATVVQELRVRWVDGTWETFAPVAPGRTHTLKRGTGTAGR